MTVLQNHLAVLRPGRAIDVGCGERANAVWLAERGWTVTAVDVSRSALDRGRAAAERRGTDVASRIEWLLSDIGAASLPTESFDLVSAFYPALRKDSDVDACALLVSLVAPGGALLFVHHAEVDRDRALAHGFDPDDYVSSDDLVAALGSTWNIERRESERNVTEGRGAHHVRDIVLIARRA